MTIKRGGLRGFCGGEKDVAVGDGRGVLEFRSRAKEKVEAGLSLR